MATRRSPRSAYLGAVLLCFAALAPFTPDAWAFARLGIPNVLLTGDGAALELGTLHAANGTQLVGPYSRFGWSHPGPAFFYLAVPLYEMSGRRGPALNLFAFLVNAVAALAIVFAARQMRGMVFALSVAAILALFGLVGLPFLLANEWNPILPILPLGLLMFLTVQLSLGALKVLPVFAFVASAIVQTHVGYAPAVFALCAFAFVSHWRMRRAPSVNTRPLSRRQWTGLATITVLIVCWALPLYEIVVDPPGNLITLVRFFTGGTQSSHAWDAALTTVAGQMAVMPWALLQALAQRPLAAPGVPLAAGIALIEVGGLAALLAVSRRRGDSLVGRFAIVGLLQGAVAVVAVQAIRGDILSYLVAWVSLTGLLFFVAAAAWLLPTLQDAVGVPRAHATIVASAAMLTGLAVLGPVPRSAVIRSPDVQVEELARDVERYLRRRDVEPPTIRIVSRDVWPTAVAVVLHLHKQNLRVYVQPEWLTVVGRAFTEPPGPHPLLLFGDRAFADEVRSRNDLSPVANTDGVSVFLGNPTS